jgi:uncharacterized protein YbjT (DUF2867 family)
MSRTPINPILNAVRWTRQNGAATIPPLLVQPIAARDVARALVEAAHSGPRNQIVEVAGPDSHDLVDMARRTFTAKGDTTTS